MFVTKITLENHVRPAKDEMIDVITYCIRLCCYPVWKSRSVIVNDPPYLYTVFSEDMNIQKYKALQEYEDMEMQRYKDCEPTEIDE